MKNSSQLPLRIYKKVLLVLLLCFTIVLLETSCEKWDLEKKDFLEVITSSSIEMGETSLDVIVFGEVKGLISESSVEQHGHVWSSTNEIPTLVDKDGQTTFLKRGNGTFSSTLEKLAPDVVYYFRAYALDGNRPVYGEVKTFTNNTITFDAVVESFANLVQISDEFQVEVTVSISNIEQGVIIADYGIVWGVEPQPNIEDDQFIFISKSSAIADGTPIIFTELLTDLESHCTFIRPYLNIGGLVLYGQEECFTVENIWLRKMDLPGESRVEPSFLSINSKAYFGLGFTIVQYLQDIWEYDPITDIWNQKNNFGGMARRGATTFSINDKGYVGTGYNGTQAFSDFWEYDPQMDAWTQKASLNGEARHSGVGFSIEDKGYIGTGYTGTFEVLQDFWEYNPQANTWTQKANFSGIERATGVGFSIDGKGYIGTGSNEISEALSDFWEYDPQSDIWTQRANFGGGVRTEAVGFSIDGKGYIGTGSNEIPEALSDFWEYDPQMDTWTQKADFRGIARSNAVGVSFSGKGYIMMGNIGLKDIWEYIPETD
ncbi:MAG: Kelch repeat-containing protein [Saprospiraceae bacterium]